MVMKKVIRWVLRGLMILWGLIGFTVVLRQPQYLTWWEAACVIPGVIIAIILGLVLIAAFIHGIGTAIEWIWSDK
jgi:ABC-type Mn2+/Zn2+ transport system permease subunit